MNKFHVLWSVYDHEREVSFPLQRAIVLGKDKAAATRLAKRLIPRIVRRHNASDSWFMVDHVGEVEIAVDDLQEWIDRMEKIAIEIQSTHRDDE